MREIGSGGYGRVYEAIDHDFGRRVALKVLDLGERDIALREGQMLAKLRHPNVLAIHDHGVGPDYRYFVLELQEGPTLRAACDGATSKQIIEHYLGAARGIGAVHAKGLVHRDFKPSNVRIGANGQAVVVDFGLARHLDTLERDFTELGLFEGTINYAPIERLRAQPGDERSDQFSFCVALWEALSGVNPFGACTHDTTTQARLQAIAAGAVGKPRASRRVVRALRRGLSPQPEQRFPSMQALHDALAPWRRPWRELLVMGAAVVLVSITLVAPMTTLLMSSGEGSSEFVVGAHLRCMGWAAISAARIGNVDGALRRLEMGKRVVLNKDLSRELAIVSGEVAVQFELQAATAVDVEQRIKYRDAALDAWNLAILFTRDAADQTLEGKARERRENGHSLVYTDSASKQDTVPSSLQTPSWHQ
nr:serine/threonine-protein kinase [Enhygromyxa salina]